MLFVGKGRRVTIYFTFWVFNKNSWFSIFLFACNLDTSITQSPIQILNSLDMVERENIFFSKSDTKLDHALCPQFGLSFIEGGGVVQYNIESAYNILSRRGWYKKEWDIF